MFALAIDRESHAGRHRVRQAILALPPVLGQRVRRPSTPTGSGVFWGVTAVNGLTVALRVQDFATPAEARNDARRVLGRVEQMVLHSVPADGNRRVFWISLDGRVVLVSGQTHTSSSAERSIIRALRAARPAEADEIGRGDA